MPACANLILLRLSLYALLVCALRPVVAAEAGATLLTETEGAAIDAVLEQGIALGFPEVRSGTWYQPASSMEFFDLRLATGEWLLGGWQLRAEPVRQKPVTDVDWIAQERVVPVPADFNWDLLRLASADLQRLRQTVGFSRIGIISDRWPGWASVLNPDLALPGAILRRRGAPDLGNRLLIQAQYQRTRAEARLCIAEGDLTRMVGYEAPGQVWNERLTHLLWLTYERCDRWREVEQAASARLGATLTLLPVATVLRRELSQWFRQRLIEAESEAVARRWQNAMLAVVDDDDRASLFTDAALLLARALVPVAPPADDLLARRLAAWDIGPFSRFEHHPFRNFDNFVKMTPSDVAERLAGSNARTKRDLAHWTLFRSCASDLDGLIALLDSDAPCRWLEDGTPRVLGDNALRALTCAWGVDPRVLVGRDRFAPWTASERVATAAAIRAWWARSRQPPTEEFIARGAELPPWSLHRLYQRSSPEERQRLVASLSATWRDAPPALHDRQSWYDFKELINEGITDPMLAALILPWPIAGSHASSLLGVHEAMNDPVPLDGVLERALAGKPTAADTEISETFSLDEALRMVLRKDTPARLRLVLRLVAGDLAMPVCEAALTEVVRSEIETDTVRLLRWACLSDQRAVPTDVVKRLLPQAQDGAPVTRWADDLRVCDVVLALASAPLDPEITPVANAALLIAGHVERDAAIAGRRIALLKPTQDLATGLGLKPEDWNALHLPAVTSDF